MKKTILSLLLINFFVAGYSQIIRGTVLNLETKSKINFAYIYFDGTFVGTNSDQDGNFVLDISKYASMPLTISALGYYSVTMKSVSPGKPLIVYMKPKVFELNEVVVSSKSRAWERQKNLRLFKNAFLGTTRNSHDCIITNEKDIILKSENDILKAYSLNPISIDNRPLGYKITYFLDEFEYYEKSESFFFSGSIMFQEDLNTNETQKKTLTSRRRNAYLGSRMHFFRSLWENNLDSAKFVVRNPEEENLIYSKIVNEKDSLTKYLQYPENLTIYYQSSLPSYIIFHEKKVFFNKKGYFNPLDISWQGEMSRQRIADWLPYEYSLAE
jgi:hypothetical protein